MGSDLQGWYDAVYEEEKCLKAAIMDDFELQQHCHYCPKDCTCIFCRELAARDIQKTTSSNKEYTEPNGSTNQQS